VNVKSKAKFRIIFLAAATLGCVCAQAWYPYPAIYDLWQQDRPFGLSGLHNSVPTDRLLQRMERFKAADLNNFCWGKPENAIHMFQAAHAAGLDWSCWASGGTNALALALQTPGNSWIMAGDEPATTEEVLEMAAIADWVRQHHPSTPIVVNLSIAKIDHDFLIAEVQPDVFSFDHYPLLRNGTTQTHYLYNVDWGRQTATEHNLPYWMYLQAYGREDPDPGRAYRIPGESDMRFLVYSFLAHGGTGIMLFSYYGHQEAMVIDTGVADPTSAAIPHRYENTTVSPPWFALRDLASEIQHLGRALTNLRTKDEVMYSGHNLLWADGPPTYSQHNPSPPIQNEPFTPHPPLQSVDLVGVVSSNGPDPELDPFKSGLNIPFDTNLDAVTWGSVADVCCGTWTVTGGMAVASSNGVDIPRLIHHPTLENQPSTTTALDSNDGWVATTRFQYSGTAYLVNVLAGPAGFGGDYELRLFGNEFVGGNLFLIDLRDYGGLTAPFPLAPDVPHEYTVHFKGLADENRVDCYIDGQKVVEDFDLDDHPGKGNGWQCNAMQLGGGGPFHGTLSIDEFIAAPPGPGVEHKGVQISFFDDAAGEEYFMIVNLMHGPNLSKKAASRTIQLGFDATVTQVERLNRWTGNVEFLQTVSGVGGQRTLTLPFEGGSGELFKWSNGNPWDLRSEN